MTTKIAIAVTSSLSFRLMTGWTEYLESHGFNVTRLASVESQTPLDGVVHVPFARALVSPWRDFKSLIALTTVLVREKPEVMESSTPKAGLLGMISAALVHVPIRIYTVRGLRYETTCGVARFLLMAVEGLSCRLSTHVLCVGNGVRERLVLDGLAQQDKLTVLLRGSSNGVDTTFFRPPLPETQLRYRLNIPAECTIAGYIGRIHRDKGIFDLLNAFSKVPYPSVRLLLVGWNELSILDKKLFQQQVDSDSRIVVLPPVAEVREIYAALDLVVLPSHREGFPNVALEAYACGLPVVGSDATGVLEAVVHNLTGLVFETGNTEQLAVCMRKLFDSPELRLRLGESAREWVKQFFRRDVIWQEKLAFIQNAMNLRNS